MRPPLFWDHKAGPLSAPLTRALLAPFALMTTVIGRWRQHHIKPQSVDIPVICVGNVSMGGSGKTPLVLALIEILQKAGHAPAALTRGYGGRLRGPVRVDPALHSARDVGDEALLLAAAAPTFIARNRANGAQAAHAAGADVLVMDDGFQNPSLAKDLSLLVIDAGADNLGLGNGRVFPAGPLREPLADALRRADAVIMMNGKGDTPAFAGPVLTARLINPVPPPTGPLFAFAGIGRPGKFFDALKKAGAELIHEAPFDDHHVYTPTQIAHLRDWAQSENARLITTQKDYVRLGKGQQEGITPWPVKAVFDDAGAITALLAALFGGEK